MVPDDVKKTTIITKSGLHEWNIMPLGLKNTISTFSRTMADIFKEWTNQFMKVFVDDVDIHNGTWSEHLCHIRLVLQKLTKVNIKLNLGKCCFGSKSITFLGHIVDCAGF
jgi:putative transposase